MSVLPSRNDPVPLDGPAAEAQGGATPQRPPTRLRGRGRRAAAVGLSLVVLLAVGASLRESRPSYARTPYAWSTVPVNGGGWVTGLVSTSSGAVYARTDVGGAYRWDDDDERWRQMVDFEGVDNPAEADYYVESLAVAPSDEDVVYMAVGDSLDERDGRILHSDDGGRTWSASSQRFTVHGNAEWRQAGARLAVDPGDPEVVLFGSRTEGLWRSDDGGRDWEEVDELPDAVTEGEEDPAGVTFVVFDPASSSSGETSTAWAGVAGVGVLRTEDAGRSWSMVHETPGGVPRDAELGGDGRLYVVVAGDSGGVVLVRPDGSEPEDVGPGGSPAVVAVDPQDPEHVFVGDEGIRDGYLWRSDDGGESWDTLDVAITAEQDVWPLRSDLEEYMSAGELAFDPARPGTLWFAEGMGVWRSDDLDDSEVTWTFASDGIEELVTNDAVVPDGSPLLTAHWDRNLVSHPSDGPAELPLTGRFNSAWSLDVAPSDPLRVVAVVDDHRFCCNEDGLGAHSGVSDDGGLTWRRFGSLVDGTHPEELAFGNIVVSGQDVDNLVWAPSNGGRVHFSTDGGNTWSPADYPGSEPHFAYFLRRDVLTADPQRAGTFYLLDADGVMRSTDGGASWQRQGSAGLPSAAALRFNATLAVVPERQDELLLTTGLLDEGSYGLFRSVDAGETWQELRGLEDVGRFGFAGAPAADGTRALFATGTLGGDAGLWRSADGARTWSLMSQAPGGRYQDITVLAGDPASPSRVVVGFTGTGAMVGEPE